MDKWLICFQPRMLETKWCWSDVPPELLSLILSQLFFRNRSSFKLVCKSWNSICPISLPLPPPIDSPHFNSPILMFSQRSSCSWKLFHSLYNEFYYLDFPELMGAEIQFSKCGWLLMSRDEFTLFFYNPFTKVKIELPSTTISFLSVCFTSPPTSSDCYIFGIFSTSSGIEIEFGHIRIGDMEWKTDTLDNGSDSFWLSNCPPLFRDGMFYYLEHKSKDIIIFDLIKDEYEWIECGKHPQINVNTNDEDDEEQEKNEKKEKEVEKEKKEEEEEEDDEDEEEEEEEEELHEYYIVEVEGEIWGVFVSDDERRVSVEKLDLAKKCWSKLESLGDKCLYISPMGSFAETCTADGMANKIYFNKFHGKSGVVYSLTSGMYYSIVGDFASKEAYGLTEVDFGTWIKPTID